MVLGVALVLGAVAAGGRGAAKGHSADGLGEAVAERIVCAAKGKCAGEELELGRGRRRSPAPRPKPPPPRRAEISGSRALGAAVKRGWLVCLAYRRWKYERDHPLTPRQAVPVRDALTMVNDCLNPWSFLFG